MSSMGLTKSFLLRTAFMRSFTTVSLMRKPPKTVDLLVISQQKEVRMRRRFQRFMYGRYGGDELSRFLSVISLVFLIASLFFKGIGQSLTFLLAIATIIFSYYRIFSRKIGDRRKENAKYQIRKQKIGTWLSLRRDILRQRKEFRFFQCPSCKSVLRVPKGKGKIRILCKKCGTAFEKKT